ncbi:unannotated protein [freshwater metagenome]|uniref:Unannotated protein n=1 Tax=freshwater metagenome TaxID=449393 RepID=A0A6J7HLH6_9ZZZZ|nr:molybdate ABC transporter substrate-binding protein [Actinomycetota bacterium]
MPSTQRNHSRPASATGSHPFVARPTVLLAALLTALLAGLLATSCSSTAKSNSAAANSAASSSSGGAQPVVSGEILISAASSLTLAFTQISEEFMKAYPEAEITLNFGSSGQLATQIEQGAPTDVAAFADAAPMRELAQAGLIVQPAQVFARNQLTLVTKSAAKSPISSLSDLGDPLALGKLGTVSLCEKTAPCGKYAEQALLAAGVSIPESKVTRGADARSTLRAVTEGDADVAIVYATDALAAAAEPRTASRIDSVPIPEEFNITSTYVMAETTQASNNTVTSNKAVAQAFMQYVLSHSGQDLLSEAGFLSP